MSAPVTRFCTQCGARLAISARFCPSCGAPHGEQAAPSPSVLASPNVTSERRPVTVLFADLAGYTDLSGALDPEETHALLSDYFAALDAILTAYGGTIDKHIGDAVMAVFGAPL